MNSIIFSGARADFLNRSRQPSYMLILLIMSLLTLFFFPVTDASYQTLEIDGYRGIYNSAWMGAALATLQVLFLPIICFYLVKNAVEKDRNHGVSELIAATPVSKTNYLLGKWLSNLFLLIGIEMAMLVATVAVQMWIGEDYQIQPMSMLLPQLFFVLPMLAIIAACALLFEMIPMLRGGLGNIAYFFLWVGLVITTATGPAGIGSIIKQMENAVLAHDPASAELGTHVGISISDEPTILKTFVWSGLDYNQTLWQAMAVTFAIAVAIFLLSPMFFDRFAKQAKVTSHVPKNGRWSKRVARFSMKLNEASTSVTKHSAALTMLRLEFLLLTKGKSSVLYLALAGLVVGQLVVDVELMQKVLIPLSLLLCVLIISPLGQREKQHNTHMLVFSCPSSLRQQFPAMLAAALLVLLLSVSGGLLRLALTMDFVALGSVIIGIVFTLALAICCGVLSGTSRTFEILYTFLWYIGPMQQHSYLDFLGADRAFSFENHLPMLFLGLSALLMVTAIMGRRRQLSYSSR
jgi:ABC-type transport system involved in multi-copper enzyme maturation permease subunit